MKQILLKLQLSLPEREAFVEFKKILELEFIPEKKGPGIIFREGDTELPLDGKSFRSLYFNYISGVYELTHRFDFMIGIGDPDEIMTYLKRLLYLLKSEGFIHFDQDQYNDFYGKVYNTN